MGLLVAWAIPACTDASRMFTGRWEATSALDETWLAGRPELVIGHYGPELTGVIFYNDALGVVPQPDCPCAFVDHNSVDLNAQEFVATSSHCAGPVLVWTLARVDLGGGDPVLRGTVGPNATQQIDIEFELVDTFVSDDLRVCDP